MKNKMKKLPWVVCYGNSDVKDALYRIYRYGGRFARFKTKREAREHMLDYCSHRGSYKNDKFVCVTPAQEGLVIRDLRKAKPCKLKYRHIKGKLGWWN